MKREPVVLQGATWAALFGGLWSALCAAGLVAVAANTDSTGVLVAVAVAVVIATVGVVAGLTARAFSVFRRPIEMIGNRPHFGDPNNRVAELRDLRQRGESLAEIVEAALDAEMAATSRLKALHLRTIGAADEVAQDTARRLHDGVLQHMIAARFKVEAGDTAETAEWLSAAERELREVAFGLSPSIAAGGLVGAVSQLPERYSDENFNVTFSDEGSVEGAPAVSSAVLRAAGELVRNAAAADGCEHAHVSLATIDESIRLTVTSDCGDFPTEAGEFELSLFAVQAEAEALGGTVDVRTADLGTTVEVRIPLEPAGPTAGPTLQVRLYGPNPAEMAAGYTEPKAQLDADALKAPGRARRRRRGHTQDNDLIPRGPTAPSA